jgi:alkanesulfonate monooxygenase SsuD/methylene tetrahydromethanopterin reductase-like flavin-dependent oxidoreductase (luciferase family)
MKFGLFGGLLAAGAASVDSNNYRQFVDYICAADTLGFHSALVVEHHFTGINQVSATLNVLSYLAARTERIRLGTAVSVLPWHNPVLLAEQITTLDLLSNGRVDIGVGKGYRSYEFHGFNMTVEEAAERYEETLNFLIRAWTTTERFSHAGKYWTFNDIVVEPTPVQRPHPPIWVGAGSQASISKAAARGFNLLLDQTAPAEVIGARIQQYCQAMTECGRRYDPANIGVTRSLFVTHSDAERESILQARTQAIISSGALKGSTTIGGPLSLGSSTDGEAALARRIVENSAIIGYPDEVIAHLKVLQAQGVEYVLICDADSSIKALRDFAREVMPEFARPGTPVAARRDLSKSSAASQTV